MNFSASYRFWILPLILLSGCVGRRQDTSNFPPESQFLLGKWQLSGVVYPSGEFLIDSDTLGGELEVSNNKCSIALKGVTDSLSFEYTIDSVQFEIDQDSAEAQLEWKTRPVLLFCNGDQYPSIGFIGLTPDTLSYVRNYHMYIFVKR